MREVHPMGIFLFSAKRCLGYRNRLQIAGSHTARLLQHCSSSVCFDRSRRQYLISRRCPLRWLVVCRDIKTQIVQLSQATANDVCAHYGSTWSLKHYYCSVILAAYQSYSSKCLCFVIFQNDCLHCIEIFLSCLQASHLTSRRISRYRIASSPCCKQVFVHQPKLIDYIVTTA